MSSDINKESKQTGVCLTFTHQKFLMGNSLKFSSAKFLHYMVFAFARNISIIMLYLNQSLSLGWLHSSGPGFIKEVLQPSGSCQFGSMGTDQPVDTKNPTDCGELVLTMYSVF